MTCLAKKTKKNSTPTPHPPKKKEIKEEDSSVCQWYVWEAFNFRCRLLCDVKHKWETTVKALIRFPAIGYIAALNTTAHRMRWVPSDTLIRLNITAQNVLSAVRYISAWTQTLYSTHAITLIPKLWITTHKLPSSLCVRHLDWLNQPCSHVFLHCHSPEPFTQTNRHPGHDAALWLASNTLHHAGVMLSAVFPVRCKPVRCKPVRCKPVGSSVALAIHWIHRH